MTLAQYIRAQFPHPVSGRNPANTNNSTCYCVGGALYLYKHRMQLGADVHDWQRFPDGREITSIIGDYQPSLPMSTKLDLASAIIQYNDAGDFEKAWRILERALAGCVDHPA